MKGLRFHPFAAKCHWAALVVIMATVSPSCHRPHHGDPTGRRFKDADEWAERFEDPARDEWQRPDYVLSLMNLTPSSRVADIGSATGYFPIRFARACPEGMVYGVDVEPDMVRYLNERADREGLANLRSIQCAPDDPKIPESVDVIFICNTYHHISDRPNYFRTCRAKLRPGGRIVNVDWVKRKMPIGPPPDHKLAAGVCIKEMAEAGYRLVKRDDSLPYQYVLVFEPDDGLIPQ